MIAVAHYILQMIEQGLMRVGIIQCYGNTEIFRGQIRITPLYYRLSGRMLVFGFKARRFAAMAVKGFYPPDLANPL